MPPFFSSGFNKSSAHRPGKDIDAPLNEAGQTMLHASAQNGDEVAVARLLRLGANPRQTDNSGQTPLHAAAIAQDLAAIKLLLEHGARFTDEDAAGITPLQWAVIKQADVAFLEQLRDLGVSLDQPGSNRRELLHAAAASNNTEVLIWLLKNRASIDAPDALGKTPLHYAVEYGAHDAIRLLLENGADPLVRNSDIKTPLFLAAEKGDMVAADILLEVPDVRRTLNDYRSFALGFTPLMAAVNGGHVALAEKLLDLGAYINDRDHKSRHSLFIAAENGTPEMIRMLISRGADVAKALPHSDNSQTMLHRLGSAHYKEKLLLLVEAGADLNARDSYGSTPLNIVTEASDPAKARTLLELGANPDIPNNAGRRPLDRAMELSYYDGAFDVAVALLAARANPDLASSENIANAPLHNAARGGSVRAVKLLLDYGATVDVQDRYSGATPWLMAVGANNSQICEMLREKGADMTAKDKTGRNVLHYAARSGATGQLAAALKDPVLRAQVNAPDASGATPLQDATKTSHADCIRLLLGAGADPLAYDGAGLTALHHLVRYSGDSLIPLFTASLKDKKGAWNVPSRLEKQTPLHLAARDGILSSVDTLLKYDVDLSLQDSRGNTPLMTAIAAERGWVLRSLMDAMKLKKIPLDQARDTAGLGALHLAVSTGYSGAPIVTALLDAGSDINLRTVSGDTSLHLAVARGRTDIIQLLLTRGANVLLTNKAGATPLDLARAINRQDLVATLQEAMKVQQKKAAQQQMPPARFVRPRPPSP